MRTQKVLLTFVLSVISSCCAVGAEESEYYTEPQIFPRPSVTAEKHFGHVGVTGLKVRIYEGVTVKVEETVPGTPAAGKFDKGDVIVGINGTKLKGKNPYVTLGNALTEAEAADGRMIFDVKPAENEGTRQVTVKIPVLGAYSDKWPLNCSKSRQIIKQAAQYYANNEEFAKKYFESDAESTRIGAALACLFLLSTGDDRYLPTVKSYVHRLAEDIDGIGDHTWNNGYNGIACAEYYLRTGDKTALPVLQYYCDNARERQFYGVSWPHWGGRINPQYVAGGLMNAAGAQVVTTLLLGKECGVDVDDKTLLGSLQFWYRFVGHGTVPYGDHRGEGGLGSNGKDGMTAAMMEVASHARGNVDIYRQARNYLGMSMLTSYPKLVTGHGDNGRGDGIWRGIASAYMLDEKPDDYHAAMKRLQWWYDLSRRPSGAFGMATVSSGHDAPGSGAAVALSYTAPLKTLRITGAPPSRHVKEFNLPEHLWGREADLEFLSLEHGEFYSKYGEEDPIHVPLHKLGNAYNRVGKGRRDMSREEMLKNLFHKRYMIRAQAAKALRRVGAFSELEKYLGHEDPRVRRAVLDGLTDYRYWFAMGKNPIKTENLTAGMIAIIREMLKDPDEALYVVDGALMALSRAPAEEIIDCLSLIMPWTTHEEWWLRQSSFTALKGAARQEDLLPKVLPKMLDMMVKEYRAQPRGGMKYYVLSLLREHEPGSLVHKQVIAAFKRAVKKSKVLPGVRAGEGTYNVVDAAVTCVKQSPETALEIARLIKERFKELENRQLPKVVPALMASREKLAPPEKEKLTELLYNDYRRHLIKAMETREDGIPLDTILALANLRNPEAGWEILGSPPPAERVWHFTSFDPQPEDVLHPRIGKRFRDVTLPEDLEEWYLPEYDASKWNSGKAPIGKGVFKGRRGDKVIENQSTWGEGEFLVMRTNFELESLDYDYYRLRVLANQGYHVYINGYKVYTYIWWKGSPFYRAIGLGPEDIKHLKKGRNLLAVYANAAFQDREQIAQIDAYLEGLKKTDLLGNN